MTISNMKDMLSAYDILSNMTEEGVTPDGGVVGIMEQLGDYMNEMGEKGQSIVLERISEKTVVQTLNCIMASLVSAMLIQEGDVSPFAFMMSESMKPFVHTIVLTTIGILVDEEIL